MYWKGENRGLEIEIACHWGCTGMSTGLDLERVGWCECLCWIERMCGGRGEWTGEKTCRRVVVGCRICGCDSGCGGVD